MFDSWLFLNSYKHHISVSFWFCLQRVFKYDHLSSFPLPPPRFKVLLSLSWTRKFLTSIPIVFLAVFFFTFFQTNQDISHPMTIITPKVKSATLHGLPNPASSNSVLSFLMFLQHPKVIPVFHSIAASSQNVPSQLFTWLDPSLIICESLQMPLLREYVMSAYLKHHPKGSTKPPCPSVNLCHSTSLSFPLSPFYNLLLHITYCWPPSSGVSFIRTRVLPFHHWISNTMNRAWHKADAQSVFVELMLL